MRANDYRVLDRAVEEGVARGWRRAHKHTDQPEPETIIAVIQECVMGEICEMFQFDEPSGGAE